MPKSYFLVPGYGAQGGGTKDVLSCFNADGLGAIVNSSRGILYAHMSNEERALCSRKEYLLRIKVVPKHKCSGTTFPYCIVIFRSFPNDCVMF